MGTFVVGAILVIVVCPIVKTAEDIVLKWNRTEDI